MTHPWPLNILQEFPACKNYSPDILPPDAGLSGEAKIDGRRLMVVKTDRGIYGYGRGIHVSGTYEPMNVDLSGIARRWPDWSAADGELFVPGRPHGYVATAIAEGEELEWLGFAVPFWDSADLRQMPYRENRRFGILECHIDFVPIQATFQSPPPREWIAKIAREREPPLEGLVLKLPECPYGVGWFKCKEVHTVDCVVTGFTEGRGKYIGLVGAIRCSVYDGNKLVEICKAGGMDDETRWEIDEDADLGRVVEIKYQNVDARGRLRHPRFNCWREDKALQDCTIDQLEEP